MHVINCKHFGKSHNVTQATFSQVLRRPLSDASGIFTGSHQSDTSRSRQTSGIYIQDGYSVEEQTESRAGRGGDHERHQQDSLGEHSSSSCG